MSRTLLAVLAHPDDESFGPGGTLARHAAEGVDVHIAIATDGAAGSVAEGQEATRLNLTAVRARELEQAVAILGGTLHSLGYRDSGMQGDPANRHPDALINQDPDTLIGRLTHLMRSVRPQVVMTHDETGGYFHPDHIACCTAVTAAFHAAGQAERYPSPGMEPFQPERLYYTAFSNRWVKVLVAVLRLRRQDPTRFGRNHDIDLTRLGIPAARLHTRIDIRRVWDVKQRASACHASQGGGAQLRFLPTVIQKQLFGHETFIRAHPPTPDGFREVSFFPT